MLAFHLNGIKRMWVVHCGNFIFNCVLLDKVYSTSYARLSLVVQIFLHFRKIVFASVVTVISKLDDWCDHVADGIVPFMNVTIIQYSRADDTSFCVDNDSGVSTLSDNWHRRLFGLRVTIVCSLLFCPLPLWYIFS